MRIARSLALTGSLLVTAAAMSGATTKAKTPTKKADNSIITCPIMHSKVAKSKAIKVVHNGKTYYVCCDSCADQIKSGKFK